MAAAAGPGDDFLSNCAVSTDMACRDPSPFVAEHVAL
jgi:hypothetical protein